MPLTPSPHKSAKWWAENIPLVVPLTPSPHKSAKWWAENIPLVVPLTPSPHKSAKWWAPAFSLHLSIYYLLIGWEVFVIVRALHLHKLENSLFSQLSNFYCVVVCWKTSSETYIFLMKNWNFNKTIILLISRPRLRSRRLLLKIPQCTSMTPFMIRCKRKRSHRF